MIEAVNSVISNAPFSRNDAEKISASQINETTQETGNSEDVSTVVTTYDTQHNAPVTQILDPQSGQVLLQFPSEISLETKEAEQQANVAEAYTLVGTGETQSSDAAQKIVSSFDIYGTSQSSESADGVEVSQTQSEAAAAALNEAAQSGTSSLSVISVQA